MLRKQAAFLFLSLAYAILLGHNVIPHHHHENLDELTEHHHTDHHHHDDPGKGSKDLSHLFSHFFHAADGFTFSSNHGISNTFAKQQLLGVAVLTNQYSLENVFIPPLLVSFYKEQVIYISPHSHPSGLRAPPANFI